jgi:hypothetical protein
MTQMALVRHGRSGPSALRNTVRAGKVVPGARPLFAPVQRPPRRREEAADWLAEKGLEVKFSRADGRRAGLTEPPTGRVVSNATSCSTQSTNARLIGTC